MDNFQIYRIKCLTNLHVGNGEANYTLVDNEVQRDIITGFPIINSSSLKGSLRSFLNFQYDIEIIKYIFGDKESGMGKYKIFAGMLLSIPVRSNVKPFFRATCPRIIRDFIEFTESFQYKLEIIEELKNIYEFMVKSKNNISILKNFNKDIEEESLKVEGMNANLEEISKLEKEREIIELFGEDLIIVNDETFSEIVNKLPVIARNKLNNGESENLWYEEVVPRETRFYFGTILDEKYKQEFERIVDSPVQIGGNATIGYGYCDIQTI